ncbi:bile acid:sodium symporter [Herbiconiux sp. KACC 21604]|uniref:bile acid:sodium symporter n=1 Tax=unclassified Herbiconiux TaxID=2618217 RepID=UPI0014932558|nr:bile acid:sodium symporter [Herbiconiux sp. SALV-R1]QJU53427.1 arsenic resistance protein [Herbiconiux sp. SALV-R1]WPO88394.1 bile acid:sodium symporter [Herbiconiux sp. KACC 21604]
MATVVRWWDARQVPIYLAALAAGAVAGLLAPGASVPLGAAITPLLALLLFATFLAVPLGELGRAVRDVRFLLTVVAVNFVAVPLVVVPLSRAVADDSGLLIGLLLVLLTPCVDYVIVFTGLAGGARARLLAATPLLMLLQIVLLPLYLLLFAGPEAVGVIEHGPFVEAFLVLVAAPLAAAALVQAATRRRSAPRVARAGAAIEGGAAAAMVPLMALVLAVVVASQLAEVGRNAAALVRLVPLYAAFLVLMLGVGLLVSRGAGLDQPGRRAVVFSGATRNSLVVLPLALALPAELGLAPLAVVTQTLVELVGMVVFVRLVPALLPTREGRGGEGSTRVTPASG